MFCYCCLVDLLNISVASDARRGLRMGDTLGMILDLVDNRNGCLQCYLTWPYHREMRKVALYSLSLFH
jgi:hypothetical protein